MAEPCSWTTGEGRLADSAGAQLSGDVVLDLTDGAEPASEGLLLDLEGDPDADGVEANLSGQTERVTASAGLGNDALFEGWMKRMLPGMGGLRANRSALSGRASLEGVNLNLYDALVPLIREVAAGNRTESVFGFSPDTIVWADSLGPPDAGPQRPE